MKPSTRLIVNTLAQYVRIGANVVFSLIATKLVLEALGGDDFGIYTLVAGVVSMLSVFTNSLSSTTQRYLSYYRPSNNINLLRAYFANSVVLHILAGVLLIIIMLSCMPLLFSGFLNIGPEQLGAARRVYITLIVMLLAALISSPFRAVLLSHENIVYLSIVDILDGVLKLAIGCTLFVFDDNRLVIYARLMCTISLFNLLALGVYSLIKYIECQGLKAKYISRQKLLQLSSFAGWTIYGSLCLIGRVQGLAIVINKFFSTVMNAAFGIALQVNSAMGSVSGALQTAVAPQVIAAEGNNDRQKMLRLSLFSCKMSFVLLSVIAIPVIFDINGLLGIWLGNVPRNCAYFSVILLVANLCDQLTVGLQITMNAVGRIRNFMLVVNTIKFSTVFVIALLLFYGVLMHWAFATYIVIEIIGCVIRIYFCVKYTGLRGKEYAEYVLLRLLIPVIVITLFYWSVRSYSFNIATFCVKLIVGSVLYGVSLYIFGLNRDEKNILKSLIRHA